MKSVGTLAAVAVVEAVMLVSLPGQSREPLPDVNEILDRTVERAEWNESQGFEARFVHHQLTVNEKLDDEESIEERQEFLHRVVPVAGEPFHRLVRKNGEPLSAKDQRNEENRERRHRDHVAERAGRAGRGTFDPDEEDRLLLDDELVSRYRFELLGLARIHGRPTFVVQFAPRAGELAVRRKIDPLLNKLAGTVWIDRDEYEIVRMEATLRSQVKMWAGILGSVRHLSLDLERTTVEADVWMPSKLILHVDMRMFFKTTHVRETVLWSDFVRVEDATQENSQ